MQKVKRQSNQRHRSREQMPRARATGGVSQICARLNGFQVTNNLESPWIPKMRAKIRSLVTAGS